MVLEGLVGLSECQSFGEVEHDAFGHRCLHFWLSVVFVTHEGACLERLCMKIFSRGLQSAADALMDAVAVNVWSDIQFVSIRQAVAILIWLLLEETVHVLCLNGDGRHWFHNCLTAGW